MTSEVSPSELVKCSSEKHFPCHKICVKCLVTSYVGSVINVKMI